MTGISPALFSLLLPATQVYFMTSYSLFELNEFIRRVLALNLPDAMWIRCELAEVKSSRGHFYLELVEKGEGSEDVIARGQAALWSSTFRILQKKLGPELNALLQEGMEVLMLARVTFHERYGLKMVVEDFDPAYSVGKLELRRREIVRQLQQANLLEKQKMLSLPVVLQNLAVLTSETAAGYQDFLEHLRANIFGYQFKLTLFQTAMQGNNVESEMRACLDKITKQAENFDAVVIIRGGGAKLDLAAFDNLALGKAVAMLQIPVFTGIGHDIDETVLDLVAFASLKTPTAVADFILNQNMQFESNLLQLSRIIKNSANLLIRQWEMQFQQILQSVNFQAKNQISRQLMALQYLEKAVSDASGRRLSTEALRIEALEGTLGVLHPEATLRRGFSMAMKAGKPLLSAREVQPGDPLELHLYKGAVLITVKEVKNE